MRFDEEEIGGKELGPVSFRFFGDINKAQSLVGLARKVLGELKRRMALSGVTTLSHNVQLEDGSKIRARAIGVDWVAIDQVDIIATAKVPPDSRQTAEPLLEFEETINGTENVSVIIGFDVHFSHLGYDSEFFSSHLAMVWEPYATSGNGVGVEAWDSGYPSTAYTLYQHLLGRFTTVGGGYHHYDPYADLADYAIPLVSNPDNTYWGAGVKTPYDLFVAGKAGFNHLHPGFTYRNNADTSGYIATISCSPYVTVNKQTIIDPIIEAEQLWYSPSTIAGNLQVAGAGRFIPGWYVLAQSYSLGANHSKTVPGRMVLDAWLSDGRIVRHVFKYDVVADHNKPSPIFFAFNPVTGVLLQYRETGVNHPCYHGSYSLIEAGLQFDVGDSSLKPVKAVIIC